MTARASSCMSLAVAVVLATVLSSGEVFAHALLDKSEPARRAVLTHAPAHVRLWFNERLEPAFCELSVLDAEGRSATAQAARVSAQNPKLLELALPTLGPGVYTVQYKVVSVDGHTVKASYTFTVKGP
jgi:methionine-rich copper-binding protein CopC